MDSEYVDEDEFGLPSISSMRRGVKRIPRSKMHDPGGGREWGRNEFSLINAESSTTRQMADSSDIAEERGPLEYPTAKKSEGKILRPQYKDILRGLFPGYIMHQQAEFGPRSCKLAPSDQSSTIIANCDSEGDRSTFNSDITHQ